VRTERHIRPMPKTGTKSAVESIGERGVVQGSNRGVRHADASPKTAAQTTASAMGGRLRGGTKQSPSCLSG